MRTFSTGATRDTDDGKIDFEGFFSPLALRRFAEYMHKHRWQADGKLRESDNWQRGVPRDSYMKSAWRHFFEWWEEHRKEKAEGGRQKAEGRNQRLEEALCAMLFNVQGYLHELVRENEASQISIARHSTDARIGSA